MSSQGTAAQTHANRHPRNDPHDDSYHCGTYQFYVGICAIVIIKFIENGHAHFNNIVKICWLLSIDGRATNRTANRGGACTTERSG